MQVYKRKIQYYETDKMGVTHHSNYIRIMEEARVNFFDQEDMRYDELEKKGIISPVVAVNGKFKKPTTFPDVLTVETSVTEYNGIKFALGYKFFNEKGEVVFEGVSEHCFLDKDMKILMIKKDYPDMHEKFLAIVEK